MTNIKHLAMGEAVANLPVVETKRTFLSTKYIYTPTGSKLKGHTYEYSPEDGQLLKRLLQMTTQQAEQVIRQQGKPQAVQLGNFRAEVVGTDQHDFLAVQLFQFADFRYHPATELLTFEGNEAAIFSSLF